MDILTISDVEEIAREARIGFCLDKYESFEQALVLVAEAKLLTKLRSAQPVAEVRTVHYGAGSPAAATVVLLHDADNYWDLRVREGMKLYSAPAVTKADPKCASCGGSGAAYGFADADCECVTTHPAPSEGDRRDAARLALIDAAEVVLNEAPCDCPHKMRFDRGEHLFGCHLLDLENAFAALSKEERAAMSKEQGNGNV